MKTLTNKYGTVTKIFTDNVEDAAITQIQEVINMRGFEEVPVRIMPDVHAGAGICVGFTAPLGEIINPSFIGADIGCQMTFIRTKLRTEWFDLVELEKKVRKEIPFGTNYSNNDEQLVWQGLLHRLDNTCRTVDYINDLLSKINMDYSTFIHSIGSVGSGNHFIEFGDVDGYLCFIIHCGSRNFGAKIAKYWINKAKQGFDKSEFICDLIRVKAQTKDKTKLPSIIKELKEKHTYNGFLTGMDKSKYIYDAKVAQAYS